LVKDVSVLKEGTALESHGAASLMQVAYAAGVARGTGRLVAAWSGGSGAIEVRDGNAWAGPFDAIGRRARETLDGFAASAPTRTTFCCDSSVEAGRGLSLVVWAKDRCLRTMDLSLASQLERELEEVRVAPARLPDPALFDDVDRRLLALLDRPRGLHELGRLARAPRFRVLGLVHFLRTVGVLGGDAPVQKNAPRPQHDTRAAALSLLGLPENADEKLAKAAFRRLAKALHPDLHPYAAEARRRELEQRLARVTAAYFALTAS
jgi:hypothetical protein